MDRLTPPQEHAHHRWHWIETEHGMMAASWYPLIGVGCWDISGYTKDCNNPFVMRDWRYAGPAIPPPSMTVDKQNTTENPVVWFDSEFMP